MKTKLKLYSIIFLLAAFFLLKACDDGPTESEKLKSPRDYMWSADTIYNPNNYQTLMSSIWGSSENNIYMCGHSSGSPGGLWHFDGSSWKVVDIFNLLGEGGSYNSVHGSSPQDVWVVGGQLENYEKRIYSPFIIRYDGINWQRYKLDEDIKSFLHSVYVKSLNDVWICGRNGIVGHYNKTYFNWNIDTLKPKVKDLTFYSISSNVNNTYAYGNAQPDEDSFRSFYIFQSANNHWQMLDSFKIGNSYTEYKFGVGNVKMTSFNRLCSIGSSFWELDGGIWHKHNLPDADYWCFDENDARNIIVAGGFGAINHFDGNTWQNLDIPNDENVLYRAILIFNEKVFLVGNLLDETPQKTIIYIGE